MHGQGEPYGLVEGSAILVSDGKIKAIAPESELEATNGSDVIDGQGQFLSPGLIDCHTHLVYGGCRADEWEMRLNGVPYEEIARQGGGILSSVRSTRQATEDELYEAAAKRLRFLIGQGVNNI